MSRSNRNRNKNKNKNKNRNQNQNQNRNNENSKKDLSEDEVFDTYDGNDSDPSKERVFVNENSQNSENNEVSNDKKDNSIDGNKENPQNIKVFFLNDVNEYIESFETILSLSRQYSRLNVVIKTSEEPKTQKLPSNIHIYTGEVWFNIHKSRELEGFYSVK